MKHFFIDKYSEIKSPLRDLGARAKIISFFALILLCVTTPPNAFLAFGGYYLIFFTLLFISKVPLGFILKRVMVTVPFILMITLFIPFMGSGGGSYNLWGLTLYQSGIILLFNIAIKAFFGVAALTLLTSTTPFNELMDGLKQVGTPKIFITIASFMYRYIFVVVNETMRMKRARDSRNFEGKWIWQTGTIGQMTATLFLRSYERGERIYSAMLSRGYDGEAKTLDKRPIIFRDIAFTTLIVSLAVLSHFSHTLTKLVSGS